MIKIKGPRGEYVEAEQMEFEPVKEDWNIYRLKDGTLVKIKVVATEIFRLSEIDELTGRPNYLVRSTNAIAIEEE